MIVLLRCKGTHPHEVFLAGVNMKQEFRVWGMSLFENVGGFVIG